MQGTPKKTEFEYVISGQVRYSVARARTMNDTLKYTIAAESFFFAWCFGVVAFSANNFFRIN